LPSAKLKSFAKINIGLKIISKRSDGYHDLETIFYPINLHDIIDVNIEPGPLDVNSINIDSDKKEIPRDNTNLCYKAIENFLTEFPQKEINNFEIFIQKNIPVGGGLAGGSSNAGVLIKYLAEYFNVDIKENWSRLVKVALETGSDVPFFLYGKPCFASGRGEHMTPLEDFKIEYDILLVNPNIHISTKEAFDALNYSIGVIQKSDLSKAKVFRADNTEAYVNDFERVIFTKYHEVEDIKDEMLNEGAVFSSMSGSGATVYGFFAPQDRSKLGELIQKFTSKKYFTYNSEH
jgi:4-diphosphocytidyl-2-C-methyl-D-erythritol kinase